MTRPSENKPPRLAEVSAVYLQDSDSCDGDDDFQTIKVATKDAGGGPYIIIETKRWAIDPDEIDTFARMLKDVIARIES